MPSAMGERQILPRQTINTFMDLGLIGPKDTHIPRAKRAVGQSAGCLTMTRIMWKKYLL